MHLLQQRDFFLSVQHQPICNKDPFQRQPSGFSCLFSPKSISVKKFMHPDYIDLNPIMGRANGIAMFLHKSCRCFHNSPFLRVHEVHDSRFRDASGGGQLA